MLNITAISDRSFATLSIAEWIEDKFVENTSEAAADDRAEPVNL